jgi:hypothetical protein
MKINRIDLRFFGENISTIDFAVREVPGFCLSGIASSSLMVMIVKAHYAKKLSCVYANEDGKSAASSTCFANNIAL